MSIIGNSFLTADHLNPEEIDGIFSRAKLFKNEYAKTSRYNHLLVGDGIDQKIAALVFFEPSTRTRISFQIAGYRIGIQSITLDNLGESSIKKGETFYDTLRTIAAMKPDILILRYGSASDIDEAIQDIDCPVVNAGIGTQEHPTQALLDAFTVLEHRGQIKGEKVLIVGDVAHSRVANSNLHLFRKLGAEVAYCAPDEFQPSDKNWSGVKHFSDLNEGMSWASVCMGLRIQKERHSQENIGLSIAEYRDKYRVGGQALKSFLADGVLLHPGPVIRGVDFSNFVLSDPRCKVLDQVNNGVFIRSSLLSFMLRMKVQG